MVQRRLVMKQVWIYVTCSLYQGFFMCIMIKKVNMNDLFLVLFNIILTYV